MRNIKEIRAEMAKLREEYEARITMLEEEIVAVRGARDYVPKPKAGSDEPYYEAGPPAGGYYEADGGSMWNGVGRSYF